MSSVLDGSSAAAMAVLQVNPQTATGQNHHDNFVNHPTAFMQDPATAMERREAEAREMDKQDREREAKLERERREEARVAEQAVHKHFQESLRLAHQKRSMQSAIPWNSYITLPSSGSRNHQGPPLQHTTLTPHSGHLYPGVPTSHPVSAAPQQQQQREREERDARERERDAQTRERDREHLAAADRLHRQTEIRDHTAGQRAAYYSATNPSQTAQQVLRPSSVPIKVEYPPPPAHSRTPKSSMQGSSHHDKPQIIGTTMPKAEPNVSLFSYSGYQPPVSYMHDIKVKTELGHKSHTGGKSLERDHHSRELLPNPPPLLSDQKSSVIVKNERNDHQKISHSSSPKMMSYSNVQQIPQQHKTVSYEYKNPTQSPHHLHHLENLQTKGGVSLSSSNHHRQQTIPPSNLPPSSHGPPPPPLHSHNRQSPLTHPHLTTHPLPSEPRYLNRSDPSLTYTTQKSLYPYPHPPTASTTPHYPLTPNSKPKVSSPAPPHIYGKPNSGIMTGTPVCRASEPTITLSPLPLTAKSGSSPYQQVLHLHGTAPQQSLPPPPAHSSRSAYESRYPNALSANKLSSAPIHSTPATVALTPRHQSTGHNVHHSNTPIQIHSQHITTIATTVTATTTTTTTTTTATTTIPTLTTMMNSNAMQTQPLDLGIERSSSPKRKADTGSTNKLGMHPVPLEIKKRKIDEPIVAHSNSQIPQIQQHQQQPQTISTSVTETSSFFVSTAMTTVTMAATNNVNSVMMPQQATPSKSSTVSVSPAPRTASGDGSLRPSSTGSVDSNLNNSQLSSVQLSPTTLPSPVLSAPGTPAKQGSITDTEKSNSPAPRPPSTTNYPVHKLKKAWLQRHSGEDGTEDTTGVVGSGSCVTLPLNISQTPSQPINKERESTASVTGSLPSAVNSIHNIGSMAVNSINKSKVTGKSGRKPTNKEVANGHTSETKNLPYVEDCSSSSDPEKKAPPKKKLPKVKRKKGAARKHQVVVEDQRRRKEEKQAAVVAGVGSDSSNDSEAGSASDASEPLSSIIQTMSRRNPTTTNCSNTSENGNSKEPRKRGRRPKAAKGNDNTGEDQQPRQKKERRDDSNSNSGNGQGEKDQGGNGQGDQVDKKPTVAELKKSGDSWVQDDCCGSFATRVVKCRECRMTPNQRRKNLPKNIFCRFYEFRKMRYTKNAQLAIAGFCDPKKDASEKDMRLWLPGNHKQPVIPTKDVKPNKNGLSGKSEDEETTEKSAIDKAELDLEMAHRLLSQVGDHFCDLFHQEKNTFHEHVGEDGTVAWKRVIQGVRELCDVCETTLFNYHWVCGRCGFVVCIDCYKDRKNNTGKIWGDSGKDRDDYSWLLCGNRMTHEPERLMLTQIIAGDGLLQLGQQLHDVRAEWGIPQHCSCTITTVVQSNELLKNLITGDSITVVNGNMKQLEASDKRQNDTNGSFDSKKNSDEKNSPLTWLADVALQSQDKNDSASDSDSDEDREGNYSTLRELLIRPSSKTNGNGSRSNSPTNNSINTSQTSSSNSVQNNTPKVGKKSKMDTLDEVISSVIEHSVNKEKDSTSNDEKPRELKHFVRRYKWTQRGREPLPIRIMTLTESKSLYPDVPHSWLCDGKLLKLNDPNNVNNYRIFQDQWKRGQPVIVSDVSKALKMDLWHPDAFARDFGDEKNDLINCMTGNLVPNQPMRKFWEGFEHFSKRLKDDKGNPMLLKLKDWPPADDFAELLPTRFSDLMKALPLSEYTHRNGRLNLASRLPECFVRPDLGPKMYNAYGSAIYPSKGTTNLHLDISDAVNVMVYVGIPKDGDNDEHVKEALKAIDEAGCDILTRRRVRDRGEAPGALWHIYAARDADKIRDLLNAVALEKGARLEPHHDPIHDQSCYLDGPLRERLYKEYGVEGYAIVQCLGDAVFVPAGAPHQVRNLHNCIKVAEDFVSPENISHCFHLTQEFRALSDAHTNHEDKLQIKNIIYHAVKDSLTILANAKEEAIRKIKIESTIKKET